MGEFAKEQTVAAPVHEAPDWREFVDEAVGQTLGRYTLLEKLGEGGYGIVYVAEQKEPIRRVVALKVLKLGLETRAIIARFEAERQALAMMDHSGIAKVFDAGTTPKGRPYFVMELVRGVRITEYCDENRLTVRKRLELFIKVCHAIQHAHQKGIIHRDIKPSNILVTKEEEEASPKVIDFGIAKAIESRFGESTAYTQAHSFVGTPAYMSPEQVEMRVDIDTRTDIYSLGTLLYELLAGATPVDGCELMAGGIEHMRKMIAGGEPMRPSSRVDALSGDLLTVVAGKRSTSGGRLISQLKGDIDWIILKCLEKDRSRRYGAASDLALDLSRHLNAEPVLARPPGAYYRFSKALQRNKIGFAAGFVVVVALFVVSALLARERGILAAMKRMEREVAEDRVYSAVLSGDELRVNETVDEAERLGLAPAKLSYFRGLHYFTTLRYPQAARELKIVHAKEPQNVAALGLLASATGIPGGWPALQPYAQSLRQARPSTAEDYLFLGLALSLADERRAWDLMNEAAAKKDSPIARLVMGYAKTIAAGQNGKLEVIDSALNEIAAASAWNRQSLPTLLIEWEAHAVAASISKKQGDLQRATIEKAAGERVSERLESFYGNALAMRTRLTHLILNGKSEEAIERVNRWSRDFPAASLEGLIPWVLLASGAHEACLKLHEPAIASQREITLTMMAKFLSSIETFGNARETLFIKNQIAGRPITTFDDVTMAIAVHQLFGERDGGIDLAINFLEAQKAKHGISYRMQPVIGYLAGEQSESQALASASTTSGYCALHHFIALRALAEGNREQARKHFELSCETDAETDIAHILSSHMLKMFRKNPKWPPTIPSKP